jgi:hypothetical protein
MMKYFSRTMLWVPALATLFMTIAVSPAEPTEIDPIARLLSVRLSGFAGEFTPNQIPRLAQHLQTLCSKYRFDPAFVLSIIQAESGFRLNARSGVGAMGLMQLMPATALGVARNTELRTGMLLDASALRDPFTNLTLGVAYLAQLRHRYRGMSPYYLLAAYNIGPVRLDSLRRQEDFEPKLTKKYYESILKGVSEFRSSLSGELQSG